MNLPSSNFSSTGLHPLRFLITSPPMSVSLRHPFGRFSLSLSGSLPESALPILARLNCVIYPPYVSLASLALFCSSASGAAAANAFSIRHGFSSELESKSLDETQLARATVGTGCYFKISLELLGSGSLPYRIIKVVTVNYLNDVLPRQSISPVSHCIGLSCFSFGDSHLSCRT